MSNPRTKFNCYRDIFKRTQLQVHGSLTESALKASFFAETTAKPGDKPDSSAKSPVDNSVRVINLDMTKPAIQKRVEKILGKSLSKTDRLAADPDDDEVPLPRKLIPKELAGYSPKSQQMELKELADLAARKSKPPLATTIEVFDLKLNPVQPTGKDSQNNFIQKKSKNTSFGNHKLSSESGLLLKAKESETPKRRDNLNKATFSAQKLQIETIMLKKDQPTRDKTSATETQTKRHSIKLSKVCSKQNLRNSETLNLTQTRPKLQSSKPDHEARRKTELPTNASHKHTVYKKSDSCLQPNSNPSREAATLPQSRTGRLVIKDRSLSPQFEFCSEPPNSLPMRESILSREDNFSKGYNSQSVNPHEFVETDKKIVEVLVCAKEVKDRQDSKQPQTSPKPASAQPPATLHKDPAAKKPRKTEPATKPPTINHKLEGKTRKSEAVKLPQTTHAKQDSPQISNKRILQSRLSFRESMLKDRLAQTYQKTGGSFVASKGQFTTPRISLLKAEKQKPELEEKSPVWYSSSKKSSDEQLHHPEAAAHPNRKSEANLKPNKLKTSRDKKISVYTSENFKKANSGDRVLDEPTASHSERINNQLFDRIAKKFEDKANLPAARSSCKSRDPVLLYKKSEQQIEPRPADPLKDLKPLSEAKDQNLKLSVEMVYVNPKYSLNCNSFIHRYEEHYHLDKADRQHHSEHAQQKSLNDASTSVSGQFVLPNKGLKDLIIDNRIIGKGSYAVVKTAYHIPSKIEVAVKIYDKFKMTDHRKKNNLKCEVSNLKEMDHSGVVRLFQKIEDATKLYLIMEFAGNYHLKDYLKLRKEGWIKPRETKTLFYKIVKGVEHIHSKNTVHRDLKLQNIVVKNLDSPKIVDFGFSRKGLFLNFDDHCGTPNYMAPELLFPKKSRKAVYADIWALGIILFYLLAEEYPFRGTLRSNRQRRRPALREDQRLPARLRTAARQNLPESPRTAAAPRPAAQAALSRDPQARVVRRTQAQEALVRSPSSDTDYSATFFPTVFHRRLAGFGV